MEGNCSEPREMEEYSDGGKDSVRVVNDREEEEEERNRYKHKIICILEYGTWYYTVR